tara:strand:- start:375 stop:563 length:189 start_codon:yes stop_codon:yes gene_type:complete
MPWKTKIKELTNKIKKHSKNTCVNKFFFASFKNGVNKITIKPLTLVIKNRGKRNTFSQKIYI